MVNMRNLKLFDPASGDVAIESVASEDELVQDQSDTVAATEASDVRDAHLSDTDDDLQPPPAKRPCKVIFSEPYSIT